MEIIDNDRAIETKEISEKDISLLSEERLNILKILSKKEMHQAELAKELKMPAQQAHYHLTILKQAGLVSVVNLEEKNGGLVKKLACTAKSLSIIISDEWRKNRKKMEVPKLFEKFIENGEFKGKIVVGSPDPHGKYRASGSELCAMELTMLLGEYASFKYPLYYLDTEIKNNPEIRRENLIVIGGPKVNMLLNELNERLPIKFDEKSFELKSQASGKAYGESIGILQTIENPWNRQKKIMVIAGTTQTGTRTAILALIKKMKEMEKGNLHDSKIQAKVVRGFDDDGDGIIDSIEILE